MSKSDLTLSSLSSLMGKLRSAQLIDPAPCLASPRPMPAMAPVSSYCLRHFTEATVRSVDLRHDPSQTTRHDQGVTTRTGRGPG